MPRKKEAVIMNASLAKRILSLIIDLLIINLTVAYPLRNALLSMPTGSAEQIYHAVMSSSRLTALSILIMLSYSSLAFLYFSLFEFKLGQTPGMMMLRLKAVSTNGDLTLGRCMVRSAFVFPFFPFYLLWIADPAYMFFSRGLRLTEHLSDTRVIEEVKLAG